MILALKLLNYDNNFNHDDNDDDDDDDRKNNTDYTLLSREKDKLSLRRICWLQKMSALGQNKQEKKMNDQREH